MAVDRLARVRRADERHDQALTRYQAAVEARRVAIVEAYEAGVSLNDLAAALGTSHEVPRRIVRDAGL